MSVKYKHVTDEEGVVWKMGSDGSFLVEHDPVSPEERKRQHQEQIDNWKKELWQYVVYGVRTPEEVLETLRQDFDFRELPPSALGQMGTYLKMLRLTQEENHVPVEEQDDSFRMYQLVWNDKSKLFYEIGEENNELQALSAIWDEERDEYIVPLWVLIGNKGYMASNSFLLQSRIIQEQGIAREIYDAESDTEDLLQAQYLSNLALWKEYLSQYDNYEPSGTEADCKRQQ